MQSSVKFDSFLRGIAIGAAALFAVGTASAQDAAAPQQTVITAARYRDVPTLSLIHI